MKDATVTTFKFFWAHQDQEQETWLRAMARQGLHLEKVNPLCFWTFRRSAPAEVVYRLDFSGARADDGFSQLMQDAGWKRTATTVGWDYWCIPVVGSKEPEIFTDGASKAKKFERMLVLMLCSALPALVVLITTDKPSLVTRMSMPSLVIISALYAGFFLFLAYSVLRLLWRIREVRAPQQV